MFALFHIPAGSPNIAGLPSTQYNLTLSYKDHNLKLIPHFDIIQHIF